MTMLVDNSRRISVLLAGRRSPKRTQALRPPSARSRTHAVYVASPTVPGAREEVHKIINTIESMWRARQIGDRLYLAAEIFRNAWDKLAGSCGGSMDLDRVRGAGAPGKPPSPPHMEAAQTINDAQRFLYSRDFEVVRFIVGDGYSIKDTAGFIGEDSRETGRILRQALTVMADKWVHIAERRDSARIASQRNFDPRAAPPASTGEVRQGKVAQAGPRGVKWSGSR